MKDSHQREIMCMQQEFNAQRYKYEQYIIRLRGELQEMLAFKNTIDLAAPEMPSFVRA